MDTILFNGKIYTKEAAQSDTEFPTAIGITADKITAIGRDAEVFAKADAWTKQIDLAGKLVLPGFVDSHAHILFYAQQETMLDLSEAVSFREVCRLIEQRIQETKERGKWVQAIGFNQDNWDEKRMPTRRDLDNISKTVPISIRRSCYHITVCNTCALQEMGILDEKSNMTDLQMDFYEDGTPNGIIREDSQNLIAQAQPELTQNEIEQLIQTACKQAASVGITEIHSDDFQFIPHDNGKKVMRAYKKLAAAKKLPIRIYQQCSLWDIKALQDFIDEGNLENRDFGFYRLGPLKLIGDGSLGAHTAWMRTPYINEPDTRGKANMCDEEIYQLCSLAHRSGMQIAIHCIGDAALQQALDTFKRIEEEYPRKNCRHGIVHCQIMDKLQQECFQSQNLLAYVQPVFLRSDMNIVDACTNLGSQSYNWRRFLDLGVHMSGGSDCPVELFTIMPNLAYAVNESGQRAFLVSGKCSNPTGSD